jgi:hypothetical protein
MKRPTKLLTAAIATSALLLSSCASVFQGTNEQIMVTSDTPNAKVSLNGSYAGSAPFSMNVKRSDLVNVSVSAPGYQTAVISDPTHVEWGYVIVDAILTGWIGIGVDFISGAIFTHDQPVVTAHLEPAPQADLPRTAIREQ